MMVRLLSSTFRSVKRPKLNPPKLSPSPLQSSPSLPKRRSQASSSSRSRSSSHSWSVYLILSTNFPIKTYVGVTTDFSRRLKQHNGELKGGAKASRAGRPWVCACIIQGFKDQSEACEFESKWKGFSRKLPRKRKDMEKQIDDLNVICLAIGGRKGCVVCLADKIEDLNVIWSGDWCFFVEFPCAVFVDWKQ